MSAITTERRDQVLVVHLDDGKANALSFDMIDGILTAIHEAENDDQIGAVVVHGREGKFSAGFDLGVMMADDQSAIVNLVANGGELVRTLYGCSVPVVAASTGHALAAGALMLLGCDVRIGADVPAPSNKVSRHDRLEVRTWIRMDRIAYRSTGRGPRTANGIACRPTGTGPSHGRTERDGWAHIAPADRDGSSELERAHPTHPSSNAYELARAPPWTRARTLELVRARTRSSS